MANQLDLSNVLYVNSNPLKTAETYSILTSDILVYEIDNPLYPGINSATQYYNNTSNQLAYITYYSTKTVNTLLAAANTGVASLVKVPVKSINKIPFAKNVDFLFPANGVQLREIDTSITEIFFKGSYYLTDTPIATIIAQANTGGGGGTNPTNLFIPYNDNGTFEDSYIKNDTSVGAEILGTIFEGEEKGFEFEFWDKFYQFGDFDWNDNGTSFLIDDAAEVVKTFYQGQDTGIILDFANDKFIFGTPLAGNSATGVTVDGTDTYIGRDYNNFNGLRTTLEARLGDIHTTYDELPITGIDLKSDKVNAEYKYRFGYDLDTTEPYSYGFKPFWLLAEADGNIGFEKAIIKTQYDSNDVGLKLDFFTNVFELGNPISYSFYADSAQIESRSAGSAYGFQIASGAHIFGIGSNGGKLVLDNNLSGEKISFHDAGGATAGFEHEIATGKTYLGKTGSVTTYLEVDAGGSFITLFSDNEIRLNDNGTGTMISGSSSGFSGDHLVINVNGNQYKIKLEDP